MNATSCTNINNMAEVGMNKIFVYDKLRIFFKHTDYYGVVHPYNYLEWTSYVREAFFSEMCGDFRRILESPIKMMTTKIELSGLKDSLFGDDIEGRFTTTQIKKVSFDVIVRFFNKRKKIVVCETRHTLVFVDSDTQRFATIPENIKNSIVFFQDSALEE